MSWVVIAEAGGSAAGPFPSEAAARAWAADEGLELDAEGSWVLPLVPPEPGALVESLGRLADAEPTTPPVRR